MSFILDALKKSENERQQQAPAEFSTLPTNPDPMPVPRWLWVLGVLLAINVVVLLGLLLRPDTPAPVTLPGALIADSARPADSAPAAGVDPEFADQIAVARAAQAQRPAVNSEPAVERPKPEPVEPTTDMALLPTLSELRIDGRMQLPELHIDIHVFSETPADRFVFINMNKYRERDQLTEGPTLLEIARDGVVLDYRGVQFVLPRE